MNYSRAILLAFGGYYFGYEVAIMNPMADPLGQIVYNLKGGELKDFQSNINAAFTLGALVAVGLAGPLSNSIGRIRWLMILEMMGIGLGYVYTIKSVYVLYLARALSGVISGSNSALGLVAISEMFPSAITGFTGLFLYIMLTGFILITSSIKPLLGNSNQRLADHWQLIMALPSFVGVIRLILMMIFFKFGKYESPGYWFARLRGEANALRLKEKLTDWFSQVYEERFVAQKTDQAI